MEVTKELLDQELVSMNAQLEHAKALVAQAAGAITVLKGLRQYLDLPEVSAQPEPENKISDANKEIQDHLEALSLKDVAEMVAGPGATAEEPEAINPEELMQAAEYEYLKQRYGEA